jgi:tRNA dimethylallyltransferase
MTDPSLRCICLTAPTACGKTELALQLAEDLPLEIVSMDSAMVYRGLDIGSAKPTVSERGRVPHHLIDILDPSETYSAGRFLADTIDAVRGINANGRLPLIVGGTMMYLRALRHGLARLPRADAHLRTAIDARAAEAGWPSLHAELGRIDPASAARIAPHDKQRIQRALEVYYATGKPLAELQQADFALPAPVEVVTIAIVPQDRAELHTRIARRFDSMLAAGLLEEVRQLRARGDLEPTLPAIRCVGYRQLWAHLEGEYGLREASERAVTATRQLAKRQLTWLRSDPADQHVDFGAKSVQSECRDFIARTVDNWY